VGSKVFLSEKQREPATPMINGAALFSPTGHHGQKSHPGTNFFDHQKEVWLLKLSLQLFTIQPTLIKLSVDGKVKRASNRVW
jgi:hypothetical protein